VGIASIKKFLKQVTGTLTEEAALTTSAGAADADRLPALNATGVLDLTITNGIVTSAGAGSANKLTALDNTGRLDQSVMPVGVVPETSSIVASEALADGDFVNVWNNSGVFNVRKADGSTTGKEAHGFVLAAVASAGTALVYFEGSNTHLTGLTAGDQYLSATTAGKSTATPPSGSGQVIQQLGVATSATSIKFAPLAPIVLA
jgi:hypothetical protein